MSCSHCSDKGYVNRRGRGAVGGWVRRECFCRTATMRPTKKRRAPVAAPITGAFIRGVGNKTVAEMLKEAVKFCAKQEAKR